MFHWTPSRYASDDHNSIGIKCLINLYFWRVDCKKLPFSTADGKISRRLTPGWTLTPIETLFSYLRYFILIGGYLIGCRTYRFHHVNRLLDIQYKVDSTSCTFSHDPLLNRNGMWLKIRNLGFLLIGQCEKPKRFYKKFKFGPGGVVAEKPSLQSDQFLPIFLKPICHFIECEQSLSFFSAFRSTN